MSQLAYSSVPAWARTLGEAAPLSTDLPDATGREYVLIGVGDPHAQPAAGTLEQCQAEMILQQLQLPADRAVGDMQVLRGAPNAAKAGRRFERAQRIEGRQQGTAHVRFPDDMRQIISIFRS